jgi:hypothetical protein
MPKWLQEMIAPTLMLWFCAVAIGVASAIGPGVQMPKRAELASSVALPLVLASWVMADARKRGHRLCYDFDSFVYFAWPVVVPVYLFQTRGTRAFLTLLCFAGIWLVAAILAFIVLLVREFA